jgi:predicted acylesterase/phospholipase RssA
VTQKPVPQRFGLALSGGGFRAVLYHLGVIRFLRDANLLPKVTHITSVSGGSVIGAHLALNWQRYCGSDQEFQEVSSELLRFLQMDVRNRIVRRFPLASILNGGRRALRMDTRRQLTRAGLLEQHYERYLYGDLGLFHLPETPRLYILATNLSEGSLCAFHRDGLLLQRRSRRGREVHFEQLELGLATVPMAVAASSAFPGFFPPLELCGRDVGAKAGEFDRHAFTDGGIYDNVGLRMFRHLQQAALLDRDSTTTATALDARTRAATIATESQMFDGTPQRERTKRTLQQGHGPNATDDGQDHIKTLHEPVRDDAQIWQNCEFASNSLQQVTETPRIEPRSNLLDGVLVSDAGASFKIRSDGRAGGLLSTALRSTDILMDRVNQMELESFADTQGVLFFPISRMVRHHQDPTAPHPEIQRQAALIRTDMDRFSNLEITSLVQHGYCVARQVFRENPVHDLEHLPTAGPWDPMEATEKGSGQLGEPSSLRDAKQALRAARTLQRSSIRKTVSELFDLRDWPTYLWIPLLSLLILAIPSILYGWRRAAIQHRQVLDAIAEASPVYRDVLDLLSDGSRTEIPTIEFREVDHVQPLDFTGYDVISDHRIYDLRQWSDDGRDAPIALMHAQLRFRRTELTAERTRLRLQLPSTESTMQVEYLPEVFRPDHQRATLATGEFLYETSLDFSHVPIGTDATLLVNQVLPPNMATYSARSGRFKFTIAANTGLVRIWVLLPEGRNHDHFRLQRSPLDQPEVVELVEATNTVELPVGTIGAVEMINPKTGYRYECSWHWK